MPAKIAEAMLRLVGIANQDAKRREFTSNDVHAALLSHPEALAVWNILGTTESGVPLVKTLVAEAADSPAQYRVHLAVEHAAHDQCAN